MFKLKGFKRMLAAAFACAMAAPVLAQDSAATASPVAWSGSTAESIATAAQGTLTNFLTGVGGIVALVIIGGLALWGAIALVGVIKKAFQTGKGR